MKDHRIAMLSVLADTLLTMTWLWVSRSVVICA